MGISPFLDAGSRGARLVLTWCRGFANIPYMDSMNEMNKNVVNQGKIVIEVHSDEIMIMFPDGEIRTAANTKAAERMAKRWSKQRANDDAISFAIIEWRKM